ncbi:MAG: hypothetical protein ACYCS7_04460 [Acidimicrobiales bacterium]
MSDAREPMLEHTRTAEPVLARTAEPVGTQALTQVEMADQLAGALRAGGPTLST